MQELLFSWDNIFVFSSQQIRSDSSCKLNTLTSNLRVSICGCGMSAVEFITLKTKTAKQNTFRKFVSKKKKPQKVWCQLRVIPPLRTTPKLFEGRIILSIDLSQFQAQYWNSNPPNMIERLGLTYIAGVRCACSEKQSIGDLAAKQWRKRRNYTGWYRRISLTSLALRFRMSSCDDIPLSRYFKTILNERRISRDRNAT